MTLRLAASIEWRIFPKRAAAMAEHGAALLVLAHAYRMEWLRLKRCAEEPLGARLSADALKLAAPRRRRAVRSGHEDALRRRETLAGANRPSRWASTISAALVCRIGTEIVSSYY